MNVQNILLSELKPYKNPLVSDLHHIMKPLELLIRMLQNFFHENSVVLDLSGGSGFTIIVCEQIHRCCFMMKKDQHYCDGIVKHWEDLTEKKVVLL